jgi:hypothetical protein
MYLQVLEETFDVKPDGLGVVVAVVLDPLHTGILEYDGVVAPCGIGEVHLLSWEEAVDEICSHTECTSSRDGLDSGDLEELMSLCYTLYSNSISISTTQQSVVHLPSSP